MNYRIASNIITIVSKISLVIMQASRAKLQLHVYTIFNFFRAIIVIENMLVREVTSIFYFSYVFTETACLSVRKLAQQLKHAVGQFLFLE